MNKGLFTPTHKNGAFDIDSKPPPTTQFVWPRAIDCAPNTIDFKPDEHTLFIVVQGTSIPIPPFREACRAGAWPNPPDNTLPNITSSTYFGLKWID
jgi:hypothetical protein